MHTADGSCSDIPAAFCDEFIQNVPRGAVIVPLPVCRFPGNSHLTDQELLEIIHLFVVFLNQPLEIISWRCLSRYIRAGLVEWTDDAVLEEYQVAFCLDLHLNVPVFDGVHHNAPVDRLLTARQVEPDHFQHGLSPQDGCRKRMVQDDRDITGAVFVDFLGQYPFCDATVSYPRMVQVGTIQRDLVH